MPEEYEIHATCDECEVAVQPDHRYCHNCGAYLSAEAVSINIFNNIDLRNVFIFYFIYLFICLLVKYTPSFNSYDELFWVEIVLAAVTLVFTVINWKGIKPLLKFNNFKWRILAGVIVISAAASLSVSFAVQELNINFFHNEINYYAAYKLYSFPTLVMIYSIALMPAVFEELAFRGIMYNYCYNFLDERLAVVVTAFLFGVMHLSLISLVWLIPFGFFIGNLRRKYHTLWYGILFHFTFNMVACLFDLYQQGEL